MNETRSGAAREWAIVGGVYLTLVLIAAVWLAVDRRPPEWDHANHLERVVHCAEDMARGDVRAIIERSSFYPPVVPCTAALVYRLAPSDAAAAQSVILAFLGLGMAAVYLLGRRLIGGTEGVVAAVKFQLPDSSTATVRARRLTDDIPVTAAAFAREVQAAVRRALADVTADVQGLEINLSYDDTILRGHVGRVEIRAGAARVGELTRPGSPVLRVADIQFVFEDVLVNPFSVHTTGRLSPLDARRASLERVTIREDDLRAFLKEQKGFKTASVKFEQGALAFVMSLPGPDVGARVRVRSATERPFALLADHVTVGGIPVPAMLVDWVVRTWDPAPRIASRLPVPVTLGRIDITPEAIRISARQ
jgi:hypothetical protein